MKKIRELYKKIKKKIDYKDIVIFLIPFLMFGVYLVVLYPGILSYDSYNQLTQIKEMTFNSSHPFFHTFIEMVLMKIVNTPAIIGLFQITFFSILWSRICKYNRSKHSKFCFNYQVLLTLLICLNPLNKIMSVTLWKDVLYSYMILLFSFEMEKLIDNKFKVDLKNIIKLALILIILPNLRHNGYLITLVMGAILFIIFFIKDKKNGKSKENRNFNYLKLIGFMFIFFLCFRGLNKVYEVDKELSVTGIGSIVDFKVLAVTGEIGRYGKYTEKDKQDIEKYIDFDCMVENTKYNALDHMWITCNINKENMKNDRINMYKKVFSMMSKNVGVSLKYYLKEWGYVWRIVRYKDSWGNINFFGINGGDWEISYTRPFEGTNMYNSVTRYLYFTRVNIIFQTIFYSGSLCLYLSVVILICLKKKYKVGMLLVFLPTLINTFGIALTASVNDVRYYYSNFLVLYLLGAILIKYWLKDEK